MNRQESIEVPRQTMNVMIRHFEVLIKDFEKMAEREAMRKVDKRLEDVKTGKVAGRVMKDYSEYMKKKGINVRL